MSTTTATRKFDTGVPPSAARAAAAVLAHEFGVPFAVHDPAEWEGEFPAADPEVRVIPLARGGYELRVPLRLGGGPPLAVRGVVPSAGGDPAREREWLARWARAVADRVRLTEEAAAAQRELDGRAAQAARAWGVVLGVDAAIRRTRVHKPDEAGVSALFEEARRAVGAEGVWWVPQCGSRRTPAVSDGLPVAPGAERLARLFVREPPRPATPVFLDDEGRSVIAVPVFDGRLLGWVAAVGRGSSARGEGGAFRRSEAVAVMPFVALVELRLRSARRFDDIRELLFGVVGALAAATDARSGFARGHSERVANVAVELGRALRLPTAALSDLHLAALLRDVGILGLREGILLKPGPLTAAEREDIRRHPVIGYEALSGLGSLERVLPAVRGHHERSDGTGYPDRLAGEDIPLAARVLAVADGYEAMGAARPHRSAMTAPEISARLRAGVGTQWHSEVVEALLKAEDKIREGGTASLARRFEDSLSVSS